MHVAVLSDTHAPRFWRSCPPALARRLEGVDVILHAGDVCIPQVLDELAGFAPVHVALGNNDGSDVAAWGAREVVELELAGVPVAMLHDSGPKAGRGQRLLRRFPDAALVVFGHSHIPWDQTTGHQRAVNPGITDRPAPSALRHHGAVAPGGRRADPGADRAGHRPAVTA